MGAPHWGQNLLSEAAPQMGQIFWAGTSASISVPVSYTHLTLPTTERV